MPYHALADLLETFAARGELVRIAAEVDPALEIAEITQRLFALGGPALLFERVRGQSQAVVTNLLGTQARLCLALGCNSLDDFVSRTQLLTHGSRPPSWLDRLRPRESVPLDRMAPKIVKVGPCQQIVKLGRDVDLAQIPALRSASGESVATITAGLMLCGDAEGRSLERLLLPVLGQNRLGVLGDGFTSLWPKVEQARAAGERLPVAVVLGGTPLMGLIAELPPAERVDPLALVGVLGEQSLELVRCRTQPLEVPAEAEMILEGFIDPAEPATDSGRVATPSGCYLEPAPCPVLQITAVTQRANAAYPALVLGGARGELVVLDRLVERILLPSIQALLPEITDLSWAEFNPRRSLLVAAIAKSYPHQARTVAGVLWGQPALMQASTLILVDAGTDIRNLATVLARVAANVRADRDFFTQPGPAGMFDQVHRHWPAKLGLDATAKLFDESPNPWPATVEAAAETRQLVDRRWNEYGLKWKP